MPVVEAGFSLYISLQLLYTAKERRCLNNVYMESMYKQIGCHIEYFQGGSEEHAASNNFILLSLKSYDTNLQYREP